MVQRQSFSTAGDSDEPVEFDINGVHFRCRSQISSGIVMKMGALLGGNEDTMAANIPVQEMIAVVQEFFQHALKPDDRKRFFEMLDDPDTPVPLNTLIQIVQWLAEVYTSRPTGQNSPPTSGNVSPGAGSTGSASPMVSISGNSPQTVATT